MNERERKRPAVFFDRDGVIIVEKNYQIDINAIEYFPDTFSAIRTLDTMFKKVVISNQSGVARGYFTEQDVVDFNRSIGRELESEGINIDGWYYCPHGPDDNCDCRKPRPGMLLKAAEELSLDLKKSWMIGDKSSDIEAGKKAGVMTILINTGYSGTEPGGQIADPDYKADNLTEAAKIINGSIN